MGASNFRHGKPWSINELEKNRSYLQARIDDSLDIEERRKLGQFSTPFLLAREIMTYGLKLSTKSEISFLEPCIGTGAFYSALLQEKSQNTILKKATGVELDKKYYDCAKELWKDTKISLFNKDFTCTVPDMTYDLLITNPPYVRHHYLTPEEKARLTDLVKTETGLSPSGLSGLYCYFMLLAHKWLSPGAVSGWLVPSEFMDVNYGSTVKEYLLNSVRLVRIHRYDPESSQFADALVSSCVVWFKNESDSSDYEVEFSFGGTHENPLQKRLVRKSVLQQERKWTRFPQKSIRDNEKEVATLGDFFTIKRGIATGDNNFFVLNKDRISELGLDMKFFRPILPSPRYLKTDCVESDNLGVPQIDRQLFLLDCQLSEDDIKADYPKMWDYLQSGASNVGQKYLCRNRKHWYWQEQREPTCFLCSYMGRGSSDVSPIRFILNYSNAIVANSYLMLYPKEQLQLAISRNPDVVYQIWEELKDINGSKIEDEGRIYGGGLKKIEPKELAKVPCGDLVELCNTTLSTAI